MNQNINVPDPPLPGVREPERPEKDMRTAEEVEDDLSREIASLDSGDTHKSRVLSGVFVVAALKEFIIVNMERGEPEDLPAVKAASTMLVDLCYPRRRGA
jgi:hypothetical protein